MKRRRIAVLLALLLALSLSACGEAAEPVPGRPDRWQEPEPTETDGTGLPPEETEIGEDGAMICDIGSWQVLRDEAFKEAWERMNGGDTAARLDFALPPEAGSTEEPDLIFEIFVLLSDLNVYTNRGYAAPEEDSPDQFEFSWPDGLTYTFRFREGGAFRDAGGDCFDTFAFLGGWSYEDIRSMFLERCGDAQPDASGGPDGGNPDGGEPGGPLEEDLDFTDGFFEWDADGDGSAEKFEITFYRNGDEAQDVLEITMVSGPPLEDGRIVISGAYEITGLTPETDGEGPSLVIFYDAGDFYSHDTPAKSRIRLRDGAFGTEELEP